MELNPVEEGKTNFINGCSLTNGVFKDNIKTTAPQNKIITAIIALCIDFLILPI